MRDFISILAWIVFLLSGATSLVGLFLLLIQVASERGGTIDLTVALTVFGGGVSGLLFSGTSLLVVGVADHLKPPEKSEQKSNSTWTMYS